MVVQSGGSRNVYVGSIEDFETYSDEKLRTDFGEYGEIELINFLKEKQCAFVNFTNITNAVRTSIVCPRFSSTSLLSRSLTHARLALQIKAIEGIKQHPDYQNLKISYGKDRCGGAPRAFRGFDIRNQQRSHQHQQQRQQGADSTNAGSGAPANGFPRSPFTADSMSFPASPMQADKLQIAEGLSTPLPEIGALELDEDAAAAATGKSD